MSEQGRMIRTIDSHWYFHQYEESGKKMPRFNADKWQRVDLPHCWNAEDVLTDEPGYARCASWYRKELPAIKLRSNNRLYLRFGAANQDTTVYIDGKEVGEHLGGYTAFAFDITDFIGGKKPNILTVRVSNKHNESVLPLGGDIMHFGGIYRSVELIETAPVHFDIVDAATTGVYIDTPEVSADKATVRIRSNVCNHLKSAKMIVLRSTIYSPEGELISILEGKGKMQDGAHAQYTQEYAEFTKPRLWSPDNPVVYRVETIVEDARSGKILDRVSNPLGFRWVAADRDKGFFLNDQRTFIKGIGKHQDYPGLGYAVPEDIHRDDARKIVEMGANMVRGHYPQPPVVYDICDEMGVMAWVKIPIMDRLSYKPAFMKSTKNMIREMILQNYNHPCVVMWGTMCEPFGEMDWYWPRPVAEDVLEENMRETRRVAQEMEDCVRELDSSRLTANDFHLDPNPQWYDEAGLTTMSDMAGWNIYMGWYQVDLDHTGQALDYTRKISPGVAYLLAEYGAGSDYRVHTYDPTIYDFSCEYQWIYHQRYLSEVAKRDWVAGQLIWTLFDFQVESRSDTMPHFNNKGMLRHDRVPKDVYYLYQAHWSDKPMVHIATNDWTERVDVAGRDGNLSTKITVFSNRDEIQLTVNGEALKSKKPRLCSSTWPVKLKPGKNVVRATVKAGGEEIYDRREIVFRPVPLNLKDGGWPGDRLCINVGQTRTYFRDPVSGNTWLPDREYKKNGFGYVDGRVHRTWTYSDPWNDIREGNGKNIRGTDLDAVFQTFLVGVGEYRIDAPAGEYDVHLLFTEPFAEELRRDPAEKTGANNKGQRVFDVSVNGQKVIERLNLPDDIGVCRPCR
ncbi:MAG: glycoside hydrolase family 2 TIM barrel-domain containing protein, partial [Candidatus Sumerlaeota bacterium]